MTSDDDENITNLMNTNIISVHTHTDQEQVAHLFRKYDLIAMPVLDSDGCLVGIVTFDDAMDVMVDETNEDISRMAAMEPNEKHILKLRFGNRQTPYFMVTRFDVFCHNHRKHYYSI